MTRLGEPVQGDESIAAARPTWPTCRRLPLRCDDPGARQDVQVSTHGVVMEAH